jgi:L-asparaginase
MLSFPRIAILATGGTIVSSATTTTGTIDYTVTDTVHDLIAAVPEAASIANLVGEQICNLPSQDISNATLLTLARRINTLFESGTADGIVVTHGTDTLEETAYFLNLTVRSPKPVVVVGAMRPATALSADGPLNLYNAVRLAASPEAQDRGVMVVMNDRIAGARSITKTHTIAPDAFSAGELGYLGLFAGEAIRFENRSLRCHTRASEFILDGLDELPAVEILFGYQSMTGTFFDAAIASGARGIVFAAPGNGSLCHAAKAGANRLLQHGIVFVNASRVGAGLVTLKPDDEENGIIAADSLNPQKARILLSLALTVTDERARIQQMFATY